MKSFKAMVLGVWAGMERKSSVEASVFSGLEDRKRLFVEGVVFLNDGQTRHPWRGARKLSVFKGILRARSAGRIALRALKPSVGRRRRGRK